MVIYLQVLEEELKKECESCKNYEAQLCKLQIASKVNCKLYYMLPIGLKLWKLNKPVYKYINILQ